MNTDHVIDKLARDISIGLQIGETQLWSALESITISGVEEVPDPGDSPTAVTVSTYLLFNKGSFKNYVDKANKVG